jgi:hypothetical protein
MFRISKSTEKSLTTLVIDGQLCGDGLATVESCCEEEMLKGKPIHLLLRDLTNIDEAGKELLRRMAGRGVKLIATGVYTSYIVGRIINSAKPSPGAGSRSHLLVQTKP